jgi:RNA polymerase sigma-70 factor (ECF subfamily)
MLRFMQESEHRASSPGPTVTPEGTGSEPALGVSRIEEGRREGEDCRIPRTGTAQRTAPHGFNAMIGQKATRPVSDFGEFFRTAYQPLVGQVIIFAGGNLDEAQDAVSDAMTEILQRWDEIRNPRAYAYRAAVSNLIKYKQRGLARIRERQIERGAVAPGQDLDSDPTVWEQQEWVKMLLNSLPSAQREVLACTFDMFTPREIAQLLGKTETAVRQNLCAARKRLACYLAEAGREEGDR